MSGKKYDVVIVGSGLGGLCSALILSKEGYKVCVLEKNRQFGGSLQIFSRDKIIFDTGIHYIGGLDEGQNLNRYFKYFGLMDKLNIKKMDIEGFDRISFKGDPKEYYHSQGYDNFIRILSEQFPGEEASLITYCNKLKEVCTFFPLYNLESGTKDLFNSTILETDTKAVIESVTSNKKLQNVLAGSNPLYAGEADKTPFYVHALISNTYIESSWKCIDGGSQISKHLIDLIKANGGEVYNYSEVKKFNFSGDEICNAELTNGDLVEGKQFISNCELLKTMDMIEPGRIRQAYRSRITQLENTPSAFILYLVLKKNTIPYFNHNKYHYETDSVWESMDYDDSNWPKSFALFPQTNSKQTKYMDSLIALAYMKSEDVSAWSESKNLIPQNKTDRGQSYDDFKQKKSEKLIETILERIPELRGNIESYHSSSPLTFRDYMGNRDGSLYGFAKNYKEPLKTFISPKTKIKNLLLTGQNLNLHGVLGVTVSSVVTCGELLGQDYLIEKIRNAS